MKNVIEVKRTIMLLNVVERDKVNVYTYVDLGNHETATAVGGKFSTELHKPLEMVMNVKVANEVFELKDGSKKFVNTANLFIVELREPK